MKIIALDVHRTFAQVAILENGKIRETVQNVGVMPL